jgi:formylglycine-generating enzyme
VEFVEILAGAFTMGWDAGDPCERPPHEVWLDVFAIATQPVTNAEYGRYLAATRVAPPRFWGEPDFADPRQPVVGISWDEASAYATWAEARLPTEAEWEKAARGGIDGARLPWGEARPEGRFIRPPCVGATPPNRFGLTDLSGVCHEWCADWFDARYYATSPRCNPPGPETGTRRVSRGGAWRHADPWSSVAHRSSLPPGLRYSDYGVRLARDVPASRAAPA